MKNSSFFPDKKGTKMTPFMGDLCTYMGQLLPYDKCNDVIEKLLGVKVPKTNLYRITNQIGEDANKVIDQIDWSESDVQSKEPDTSNNTECDIEYAYAGMDGTMILTREEKWKEVKLGRSFKAYNIDNQSENRTNISQSNYVAILGSKDDFLPRMDRVLEQTISNKSKLILLNDGATWIDNYIKLKHPECISIIDFFHVCEKLADFSKKCVPKGKREKWYKDRKDQLLSQGGKSVLEEIEKIQVKTQERQEEKRKIVTYFENHLHKMNYPEYDKKGYYIGSGFIESAHRKVIQDRMKRSGQRWSIPGAGNMLNLRTLYESGRWATLTRKLFRAA